MSHVNILAINPRFALTYGEKRKEAEPESTFDLPAERRRAFRQVKFLRARFSALWPGGSFITTNRRMPGLYWAHPAQAPDRAIRSDSAQTAKRLNLLHHETIKPLPRIPGCSFALQNSENNRAAVIPLLSLARFGWPTPRLQKPKLCLIELF
jgi:hypothetical protein